MSRWLRTALLSKSQEQRRGKATLPCRHWAAIGDSHPSPPSCQPLINEFSTGHLVSRNLSYLQEKEAAQWLHRFTGAIRLYPLGKDDHRGERHPGDMGTNPGGDNGLGQAEQGPDEEVTVSQTTRERFLSRWGTPTGASPPAAHPSRPNPAALQLGPISQRSHITRSLPGLRARSGNAQKKEAFATSICQGITRVNSPHSHKPPGCDRAEQGSWRSKSHRWVIIPSLITPDWLDS